MNFITFSMGIEQFTRVFLTLVFVSGLIYLGTKLRLQCYFSSMVRNDVDSSYEGRNLNET